MVRLLQKSILKKMGQPAQTPPIRKYPIAFQQMSLLTKNQAIRLPLRPKETYIRVDQIKQLERYQLYADPTVLADYLTPYFKSRLSAASPDAIIEEFGTHILIDFNVGGRLSIFYKSTITDNLKVESKTKIAKGGITGAIKNG